MDNRNDITLFLCGDVMLGRGIDQALPHPSDPTLHEPAVLSAHAYLDLAEQAHGPIATPMRFNQPWGKALTELTRLQPDLRLINLETSITTSNQWDRAKGIHYRMHPKNVPCLTAAGIDGCTLANNHVLDWGRPGLIETLETLQQVGIATAGAGRDLNEASAPITWTLPHEQRVQMFAIACASSGVPASWAATSQQLGIYYLPDAPRIAEPTTAAVIKHILRHSRADDIVIVSIHWGENWGYDVPEAHANFAHRLIDEAGVDLVHGHSSHHVKAFEVYRDRLILYGCGDFLTDYEGISGYTNYRPELTLMYLPSLERRTGRLARLRLVPMRVRGFTLHHATAEEAAWLTTTLNREAGRFGAGVRQTTDEPIRIAATWRRPRPQ